MSLMSFASAYAQALAASVSEGQLQEWYAAAGFNEESARESARDWVMDNSGDLIEEALDALEARIGKLPKAAPWPQLGFRVEGTGGGCQAYWLDRDPVYYMVTAADDPSLPSENLAEPVCLGIYLLASGDCVFHHVFRDAAMAQAAITNL